ncbi:MAG: cache domain-containing protein [bacterium]|uniref:Cache domain-containing protein n=1 Tax=Candidatus Methylomirabilis tolerans TaxID=3123416 RepID=A0AAJ1EJD1_9BACT|nr:cache domain-containing protein [Candidatus Methylomirabilis sp.]
MKRRALYGGIFILFGVVFLLASPGLSATPEPQSEQAKQIKALVNKTVTFIESKGKGAFPELKKKDSEWYKGDTYIFVNDMNGTVLLLPTEPELEGKNLIDMKDANGKLWMRAFIETAKTRGSGWVDYMWPKPGTDKPSKKISYIKKAKMPDGKMVFVGAGMYVE